MKHLLLLALITLTGCSTLTKTNTATSFTNTTTTENTQNKAISLQTPIAANTQFPAVADSINNFTTYIKQTLAPAPADIFGKLETSLTWTADVNNNVTQLTLQSYLFTGGAHGQTQVTTVLFDNATAQRINPRTLFADTTRFLSLVADQIAADSLPLFPEFSKTLPMPKNIVLDSVSVTALYNQYEIAPYFVGVIQVSVPYKNLGESFDTTAILPSTLKEIKCPVE